MAITRIKTFITGEVLTASDLNSELDNPINNALSLISPLTGNLDFNSLSALNFGISVGGFRYTITGAPTANRTVTFPDSNVTLGAGAPFADTTSIVEGSADDTKELRFEVDGFTTGTVRVLTPPNYDGTIATLAGTETLTNKTFTAPTIADYTNAAHDHGDADDAGALVGAMSTVRKTTAFTTTSTTFVDVTDHTITMTTRARRVLLTFSGSFSNNTSLSDVSVTFDIDGTDAGGSEGLNKLTAAAADLKTMGGMVYLTDVLTAASHTFKVNLKNGGGADIANIFGNPNSVFTAVEVPY